MKIYTKTGDDGTTSLFDGTRVLKDHKRVCLYGELDELNGVIGLVVSYLDDADFRAELHEVQKDLFALGAQLANPSHKKQKQKSDFSEEKVLRLEKQIDTMERSLKPMTSFILPGGTNAASALHLARTICRRAERSLVHFNHAVTELDDIFIRYVNRLSDYLFVAARYANFLEDQEDIPW